MNTTQVFLKKMNETITLLNEVKYRHDIVKVTPAGDPSVFKKINIDNLKEYYNSISDDNNKVLSSFLSYNVSFPTSRDEFSSRNMFPYDLLTIFTLSDECYAYLEMINLLED